VARALVRSIALIFGILGVPVGTAGATTDSTKVRIGPVVSITPSSGTSSAPTGTSGNSVSFTVTNTGNQTGTFEASCSNSGNVTCSTMILDGEGEPSGFDLEPSQAMGITVYYSAGAVGSGTISLFSATESPYNSQTRSYTITVTGSSLPPAVALERHSRTGMDRSLCLITGAGPAASVCGDLTTSHSMPGYRTMGRDRALSLVYTSNGSGGLTLIGTKVTQPAGIPTPTKVTAILNIATGGAGTTDSVDYSGFGAGTVRQLVLGRNLASIASGIYPFTLRVKNVFSGSVAETVITDTVVVVNHSASEFGRGWMLGGVERILTGQLGGAVLWLGGDGSGLWYRKLNDSTWVAPQMEYQDTLKRTGSPHVYTRYLRHGVRVVYDATGRHTQTINRQNWTTNFVWSAVGGQTRLTEVRVPGADTVTRRYQLFYNSGNQMLDSIRDPVLRTLRITRNGTQDSLFTDPDGRVTGFSYYSGHQRMKAIGVPATGVVYGVRWVYFDYNRGTRLTGVSVPRDSTVSNYLITTLTPWDQNGQGVAGISNVPATYTGSGLASLIDGPLSGTGDESQIWVDRFGAPTKIVKTFNSATTTIARTDAARPALVTQIDYPLGRRVKLTYNARANLIRQWDSTAGLAIGVDSFAYGSTTDLDGPTYIKDPMGRVTTTTYNSNGLPSTITAPSGQVTAFTYLANRLVDSVVERSVSVWVDSLSTSQTRDLANTFTYDNMGNVRLSQNQVGVIYTTYADSIGRPTLSWDPYGTLQRVTYDAMNRVIRQTTYKNAQSNPYGSGSPLASTPLSECRTAEFICADSTRAWRTPMPDSLVVRTFHGLTGVDSILDPRGVHRGYRYHATGAQVRELDENRHPSITYIGLTTGLVDSVRMRDSMVVRYGYDGMGRRTWMAWRARSYPARGNGGILAGTVPADSVVYTYDLEDRITETRSTRPGRGKVTRTFFANGAVKTQVSTWPFTDSLTYSYDASGARTSVLHKTFEGGQVAHDTTFYTYSGTTGFLTTMVVKVVAPTGFPTKTVTFGFDALGRRTSVTYPNGYRVNMVYDALGMMRRFEADAGSGYASCATDNNFCVQMVDTRVDARGLTLFSTTKCKGDDNRFDYACQQFGSQMHVQSRYFRTGWLSDQISGSQPVSPTIFRADSMDYDASGNISRRFDDLENYWHRNVMEDSTSNRLYLDTLEHANGQPGGKRQFWYDGNGSRYQEENIGIAFQQLIQNRYWFNDGLGRVSGLGEWRGILHRPWDPPPAYGTFTDPEACWYDAEGRAVRTCGARHDIAYDGENVATASYGIWHFFHGPGLDDPIFGIGQSFSGGYKLEVYWATDGKGRQFAVSEPDGEFNENLILWEGWDGWKQAGASRHSFTMKSQRQENYEAPGLSYFRNRVYDQGTGRWTQEDPMGVAGGINLYQFNGNNPVAFSDPFGLCPDPNDPTCPEEIFTGRGGVGLGLKYGAEGGPIKVGLGISIQATGGIRQEADPATGAVSHRLVGGASATATVKATVWGHGPNIEFGPRSGVDAEGTDRNTGGMGELGNRPVEGNGRVTVEGTIPFIFAGPVPVGGWHFKATVDFGALWRRLRN
jgi:RHS repeat-associated protein